MAKPKKETPVTPLQRPALKLDPHEAIELELKGSADHPLLAAAARLYCKHLAELKKKAEAMDRTADAKKFEKEAEGLTVELVEQFDAGRHDQVFPRHRPVIAAGLDFLATNLKAAKGTLSALGSWTDAWVSELDKAAGYVEAFLLPNFRDQLELAPELPKDGKAAAAGKDLEDGPVWVCPDCKKHYDHVPKTCEVCGYDVATKTPDPSE